MEYSLSSPIWIRPHDLVAKFKALLKVGPLSVWDAARAADSTVVSISAPLRAAVDGYSRIYERDYGKLYARLDRPTTGEPSIDVACANSARLVSEASVFYASLGARTVHIPTFSDPTRKACLRNDAWAELLWSSNRNPRAACNVGTAMLYEGWCFFTDTQEYLTREQFLMVVDVVRQRAQTLLAIEAGIDDNDRSSLTRVPAIWKWQEDVLERYGNKGFELAKAVEAIFKTRVSALTGGDFTQPSSFDQMVSKTRSKEEKWDRVCPMTTELVALAASAMTVSACVVSFGAMKCCGHPTIDPRASAAALQATAQTTRQEQVVCATVIRLRSKVMELMTKGYIEKSGEWPPFLIPPKQGTALGRLYRERAKVLIKGDYDLLDFATVRFAKFLELPTSLDYSTLLDDKAISEPRSTFATYWDGSNLVQRRLLMRILSMQTYDTSRLLAMAHDDTWIREAVIALTCKNQEMKVNARCFSMDDLDARSILNIIEQGVGVVMDECKLPTTMTESRAEIDERFQSLTKPNRHVRSFFIEGDLSAWNTCWRDYVVNPVSRIFDDAFGTVRLFTLPHRYFKGATIAMRAPGTRPRGRGDDRLYDPDLTWGRSYGNPHLGGLEGKYQKGWTVCTIATAELAADDAAVDADFVVQGDNLIACVRVRQGDPRSDADVAKDLMNALERRFREVGQDLKPDESLVSSSTVTYSKRFWSDGIELSLGIKALSRVQASSPGTDLGCANGCEAISSGCVAASGRSTTPSRYYVMQQLLIGIFLYHASVYGRRSAAIEAIKHAPTYDMFVGLGSALGGPAVSQPQSYVYRGSVDELSDILAMHRRIAAMAPRSKRVLGVLESGSVMSANPRIERLLEDPRAIPLDVEGSTTARLRDGITAVIDDACANLDIKEAVDLSANKQENAEILLTMRPLLPLVVRDLIDATPTGVARRILGRFVNSSTLRDLGRNCGVDFIGVVRDEDSIRIRWAKRFVKARISPCERSAFDLTTRLRAAWGTDTDLAGVTMLSPFAAAVKQAPSKGAVGCAVLTLDLDEASTTRGPARVYFGNKTRAKTDDQGYVVQSRDNATSSLRRLVQAISQMNPGPNLRGWADKLCRATAGISLTRAESLFPVAIGGTTAHRSDELRRAAFYINCGGPVLSHIYLTANDASQLADDYPVAIQQYYLLAQWLTNERVFARTGRSAFISIDVTQIPVVPTGRPDIAQFDGSYDVPSRANPLLRTTGFAVASKRRDWPSQWSTDATAENARTILQALFDDAIVATGSLDAGWSTTKAAEVSDLLDVAEFEKFGVDGVLDSCAVSIARAVLYRSTILCLSDPGYADATARLIYVYAAACAKVLGPLCSKGSTNALSDSCRYGYVLRRGKLGAVERDRALTDLLAARGRAAACKLTRLLAPTSCFPDDNQSVVKLRACMFATLWQLAPAKKRGAWLRARARIILESEASTETRASNLIAATLDVISRIKGERAAAAESAIREGFMVASERSSAVARRSLRELPVRVVRFTHEHVPRPVYWVELPAVKNAYDRACSVTSTLRDRLTRLLARKGGLGSTLTCLFVSVVASVGVRGDALIIGAGEGAWTAACLVTGMRNVEEIDLISERPHVAQDGLLAPSAESALVAGCLATAVRPAAMTFSHGGDIYSSGALSAIEFSRYSLVVYDVQRYPEREDLSLIRKIAESSVTILVRLLLKEDEIGDVGSKLGNRIPLYTQLSKDSMVDVVFAIGVNIEPSMRPSVTEAEASYHAAGIEFVGRVVPVTAASTSGDTHNELLATNRKLLREIAAMPVDKRPISVLRRLAEERIVLLLARRLANGDIDGTLAAIERGYETESTLRLAPASATMKLLAERACRVATRMRCTE